MLFLKCESEVTPDSSHLQNIIWVVQVMDRLSSPTSFFLST